MNSEILNIIVCPVCKETFGICDDHYLYCGNCKRKFEIIDDVPILLVRKKTIFTKKHDYDSVIQYHLRELQTAKDPNDPRHIMPTFKKHHSTILDIGCGIGQTIYASDIYNDNEKKLLGIDIDLDVLIYGCRHYPNINFINACSESLPIQSNMVDIAISRTSLPYTNINKSIEEIYRVLKPNGEIWITLHSFRMVYKHFLRSCRNLEWKDVIFRSYVMLNGLYFHLFGRLFHFPIVRRIESFQTKKRMERLLMKNNFRDIRITQGNHFLITATKKT